MKHYRVYQEIFREDLINPNGCSIKGTFFVSHKYTNYSAVQVRKNERKSKTRRRHNVTL